MREGAHQVRSKGKDPYRGRRTVIRMSLSQIFAELGHSMRSAEDGSWALLEIRQEVPDILLSDLNMPGMSGFELLSVVRTCFPTIPLIAMSAFSAARCRLRLSPTPSMKKATSIGFLLQIVEAICRSELPPSVQHPSELAPVWIRSNQRDASGEVYLMITCPECLRIFPKYVSEATGPIQQAGCVYCDGVIAYAIVQVTDSSSAQAPLQKPNSAIPIPLDPIDLT